MSIIESYNQRLRPRGPRGTCDKITSSFLSLLNVDPGVENLIISFVASGDGGLRDVLSLRLVCRTTRSWVDTLPKPQATVAFINAVVVIDYTESDLSEFLLSPPPFRVTALTLDDESGTVEKKTAARFHAYWSSKLWTFKLKNRTCRPQIHFSQPFNHHNLGLMESNSLLKLQIERPFYLFRPGSGLSLCFEKITELHLFSCCLGDTQKSELFSVLENNSNLRVFGVDLLIPEDFRVVSKLIRHKRTDTQLQVHLNLANALQTWDTLSDRQVFREFVHSIVASMSDIQIQNIYILVYLQEIMDLLIERNVCLKLYSRIHSVANWRPAEETLSLLQSFSRLQRIESIDVGRSIVNFDRLALPTSLKFLGLNNRFPPCGILPELLTSLRLNNEKSDINSFLGWLNLLRGRCSQLASLCIQFDATQTPEERPLTNFQISPGFTKLRTLTLDGLIKTDFVEECRVAFGHGLDFHNVELEELNLYLLTDWNPKKNYSLLDVQILRPLLEGPSANSLQKIEIRNDNAVTLRALPLLKRLRSLVLNNLKKKKERQWISRRNRNN